jgi:hypothetical protein
LEKYKLNAKKVPIRIDGKLVERFGVHPVGLFLLPMHGIYFGLIQRICFVIMDICRPIVSGHYGYLFTPAFTSEHWLHISLALSVFTCFINLKVLQGMALSKTRKVMGSIPVARPSSMH